MKTKEKYSFKPGDKIFAKVKGFVYWPARVNPIPEDVILPPNKIPIFFYGTHEVYFISPSSCWPFDEKNKTKWGKPRSRSHFNQAMDEIENNPTLLQYGVDPDAEKYLAQFYDFKKSDGNTNIISKTEINSMYITEDLQTLKTKKEPIKRRNKSGSSISTKENKSTTSIKNEVQDKIQNNELEIMDSVKEETDGKFKMEEETERKEEVKNENNLKITEHKKEETHSKVFRDDENLPKLRTRSKSSTKNEPKKRKSLAVTNNKSEEGSDSEAVCSDNSNDEDFEPAKKSARVTTKTLSRTNKSRKSEVSQKVPRKSRVNSKTVPKVPLKKKNNTKTDDIDSLSSISSIEDWKEKDEKRKKEHEEAVKQALKEELFKEEQAIKEASRQARKKSYSKSSIDEEKVKNVLTEENRENVVKQDISGEVAEVESSFIGKEVIVEISIRDIGKNGDTSTHINDSTDKSLDKTDFLSDDLKLQDITKENYLKNNIQENELSQNVNISDKCPEEIFLESIVEKKEISHVIKNTEKNTQNKRMSSKQSKKERVTSRKSTSNLKRLKLDSDDSEHESFVNNKKYKLNHSSDSDCEITSDVVKHTKVLTNSENDSNTLFHNKPSTINNNTTGSETIAEIVKQLQSFNSDIRSSLVLGHEDYIKCLNTFKSLCSMELNVLSLVSVWQLMDTVKKCRRYKRNESVKTEAQNVYKRFLDVYSKSTADEHHKAEAILFKYRHGHNVSPEYTVSKTDSVINGHSQNQSMPFSVEDMFHSKQTNHMVIKAVKVNSKTTEVPPSSVDLSLSFNTQKEKLDAEKMRLLSADLEAKVSDILNKIEKNSALSNPINQRSLSHLLPQQSPNHSMINLPVEWEPVKDIDRRVQERGKINDIDNDLDGSDDDDDVEAIVKRIENVPIKMIEVVDPEEEEEEVLLPSSGTTSALDWRIENLFNNNSFIKGSNIINKESHNSSSKKHRQLKSHIHKSNVRVNPSPPRFILAEKKEEIIHEIKKKADAIDLLEDGEIVDIVEPEVVTDTKNADNDIYDLLGV